MLDQAHFTYITAALLERLSEHSPEWRVGPDGLIGPGSTGVRLSGHGEGEYGHLDIGFVLNRNNADAPVLWDCVAVPPGEPLAASIFAARVWIGSTLPPILELFDRRGEFGVHVGPDTPGGLPERHVVYGPVFGWGGEGSTELLEWVADRPLLVGLGDLVVPLLRGPIDLVKVIVGGTAGDEVVEVRVGRRDVAEAERRLLDRNWPRPASPFFSRSVMLVLAGG
ncbi:DUF6348 family protein [Embleya sp. NBC_00896]|uniref:DUF6348 family protein n=1 Tax=Embleya sp. NBC_00896 TaxID=2975961 RepID=UPI00386EDA0F|nr:DUF6348 family protein [Embleya sp. NBC_00896]